MGVFTLRYWVMLAPNTKHIKISLMFLSILKYTQVVGVFSSLIYAQVFLVCHLLILLIFGHGLPK
jgi:hypothetical protein